MAAFDKFPKSMVKSRALSFSLGSFFVLLWLTGIWMNIDPRHPMTKVDLDSTELHPAPPVDFDQMKKEMGPALGFTLGVARSWIRFPKVCVADSAQNELQREACRLYSAELWIASGIALLPFIICFFLYSSLYNGVRKFYRQAELRLRKLRFEFVGVVTDPPLAKGGVSGWLKGLSAYRVELPNKAQVSVLMESTGTVIKAGDKVEVWRVGETWVGRPHLPHLFVV